MCFDQAISPSDASIKAIHDFRVSRDISMIQMNERKSADIIEDYEQAKSASTKTGIDDFLAQYKHEQSSIFEFISCLDERSHTPRPQVKKEVFDQQAEESVNFVASHESQDLYVTHHRPVGSTNDMLPSIRKLEEKSSHIVQRPKALKSSIETLARKRAKLNLTVEEREERRRQQNREAQRRFRDRQMLQSCFHQALEPHTPSFIRHSRNL